MFCEIVDEIFTRDLDMYTIILHVLEGSLQEMYKNIHSPGPVTTVNYNTTQLAN